MSEKHRRHVVASRFAGRDPIDVGELVRNSYPDQMHLAEQLIHSWKQAASVLKIDGRLLRANDRFDDILAPVKGYPMDDEVDDLSELVRESAADSGLEIDPAAVSTFGDCVLFLAVASQQNEG